MNKLELDDITRLVECYFEGTTSRDEEHRLYAFFKNTPRNKLPDNLIDAATLFRALNNQMSSRSIHIPDNLASKLDGHIDSLASRTKRRHRIIAFVSAIGSAAAAVVLALLAFWPAQPLQQTQPHGLIAEVGKIKQYQVIDNYIVVEDGEDAQRLVSSAMSLIGDKMARASSELNRANGKYNDFSTNLKNILNNEKN